MGAISGELESVRVARLLRDDIVLGRRRPGAKLVERDIAAELAVSRLPVREAIRMLDAEGIVVTRPRTWAIVREFSLREIQDFAEVRQSIELLMFVYATERHDEAGLAELRQLVEREEHAARVGDVAGSRAVASAFHVYMAVLAGSDMLTEMVRVFGTRLKWVFGPHNDLEEMAREHRGLYDAIAARDVELVKERIVQHLQKGLESAVRRFQSDASSPATLGE